MTLRWLVAAAHLLALGIGLGAVWGRSRALRGPVLDNAAIRRALAADAWWGVAALLWLGTGVWRAFGGLEKGTSYYLANTAFHAKMGLFLLVLVLEIRPMLTLMRWRRALSRGTRLDTEGARTISRLSAVQALLIVGIVLAATAMARGLGLRG
ncbi:DUF2214 family protein [Roseisolibacter agri]|uniref:DUF2214 domain-containing protein n=1 Tax=Roseisolibacter agri TaxID=2014610 RepID=A0AA37Q192_9BACT|nr:DUF2214 family protein [Roseisolibacter agri]GLC24519.1 hypothetical protein rosag_10320 [Roseisolibacter agri]